MDAALQTKNSSNLKLDYMKLLVTQMQNQNPLEPMSNKDLTAQLTQFSQLEHLEAMNKNFDSVLASIDHSYGGSLLGKNVTFTVDDNGKNVTKTAVVNEIMTDASTGETKLKVLEGTGKERTELQKNPYTGKTYLKLIKSDPVEHIIGLKDVTMVNAAGSAMNISNAYNRQFASSLVGKKITFNSMINPGTGEIEKVTGMVESVETNPGTGVNSLKVNANGQSYNVALDTIRTITN